MKRAYFGMPHKDADFGYGIVAESISQAKQLLFGGYDNEGDWNWIDMQVRARPDVNVEDMEIGIVEDLRLGLIAGFYSMIREFPCDICGNVSDVELYNGKVVCEGCYDYLAKAKREVSK